MPLKLATVTVTHHPTPSSGPVRSISSDCKLSASLLHTVSNFALSQIDSHQLILLAFGIIQLFCSSLPLHFVMFQLFFSNRPLHFVMFQFVHWIVLLASEIFQLFWSSQPFILVTLLFFCLSHLFVSASCFETDPL